MLLIDIYKVSSVSAWKLRCPSSALLATFPARLGSAREISAQTHHYQIHTTSWYILQIHKRRPFWISHLSIWIPLTLRPARCRSERRSAGRIARWIISSNICRIHTGSLSKYKKIHQYQKFLQKNTSIIRKCYLYLLLF